MKNTLFILLALLFFQACSETKKEEKPNIPIDMPTDFYAAVREAGGERPHDNVFYLSPDSISREAWFYNFRSYTNLDPDPVGLKGLYQKLMNWHPEKFTTFKDSVNRAFKRGGEILELRINGQQILVSNAAQSHISVEDASSFFQACDLIRKFVVDKLRPFMQRVELEIDYDRCSREVEAVEVSLNEFGLSNWDLTKSPEKPIRGNNTIPPGKYHLTAKVRYEQDFAFLQDTLEIGNTPLKLKLRVFDDKLALDK